MVISISLQPKSKQTMAMNKKILTKVVCTIGPNSSSKERIQQLVEAGMDIARLNFSHGSTEDHLAVIKNIKDTRERSGRYIGIALDTKGPETRISTKDGMDIKVSAGDILEFCTVPSKDGILVSPIKLEFLKVNDKIFIDDGLLALRIAEVGNNNFSCEALNKHTIKNNKSMNFPGIDIGLKSLSEKDKKDIAFGLDNEVDFIFASFINNSSDIDEIREFVLDKDVLIVSKIESLCAMNNLEEIVSASDGVMAARGDLGVEIGLENVFSAQKEIFSIARKHNKPVICATQMMESMVEKNTPNRSEVSDVGNAVLDGCDCVMLSGETAVGLFPVRTVNFMKRICFNAEEYSLRSSHRGLQLGSLFPGICNITMPSPTMSQVKSVYLANLMLPIVVVSDNRRLLGRLCIYKGIIPVFAENCSEERMETILRKLGFGGRILVIDDEQVKIKSIS